MGSPLAYLTQPVAVLRQKVSPAIRRLRLVVFAVPDPQDICGDQMQIAVVVPSLLIGGAEQAALRLSAEWQRLGHEVKVWVLGDASPAQLLSVPEEVTVCQVMRADLVRATGVRLRWLQVSLVAKLAARMRSTHPDVVVTFMDSASQLTLLASRFVCRRPRIAISVHTDPRRYSVSQRRLARVLYGCADVVIAVSAGAGRILSGLLGSATPIRICANPLDIRESELDGSFRSAYESNVILAVGRLAKVKGFDRLLTVMQALGPRGIRLRIVGEGPEAAHLASKAEELGVRDRVDFVGARSDVREFYARAVCLAMTSHSEARPMVIQEAMAQGCPVVAFDVDFGPRELITNGVDGLLIPDGSTEEFADAVWTLASNREMRTSLSDAARRTASQWTADRVARDWLDAIGVTPTVLVSRSGRFPTT